MSAGPERTTGLDDDHLYVVGRPLPRRPDPEPADAYAVVELAPALFPAIRELRSLHIGEDRAQAALTRHVGVRGQLDRATDVPLLDALREQLEHDGPAFLGTLEGDEDGDALQRKCAFSRPSRPVSSSYISPLSLAASVSRSSR